ncbi:PREDICTED: poly(U)-specific endoribonuclease homolog isoform X2 [Dinoponera quadriceps]|uniref:Poly(U)-specific endoribonuclease homolog isoform X2 n=1 Tax=Dinoponera quadriceps TaxID=609295 RepID=A0A6P3WTT5_DINQU|nr:PREDICTED: poly(U)-specific endoribonuclease homolog isoform X2 [Dinoponera quadriceps]
MTAKNRYFVIFAISLSLFIGNIEAGWKFWKKETTTTTTTTPTPENVQLTPSPTPELTRPQATTAKGSTVPAVNTGGAIIGAANPGLAIGAGTTGQNVPNNVRPGRPNPGTEVGQHVALPKLNRPAADGGQNYRNWAADLTGAGEPPRNQPSRIPIQGPQGPQGPQPPQGPQRPQEPISGGQTQPNLPSTDSRPQPKTSQPAAPNRIPGNIPTQPTQPSSTGPRPGSMLGIAVQPTRPQVTPDPIAAISGDRSRPGTPTSSISGASWPDVAGGDSRSASLTGSPRQPDYPRQPNVDASGAGGTNQNRPSTPSPSPGKSWADVTAGGSRPSSPTGLPRQPAPGGENDRRTIGRPAQPDDSRPPSPGVASPGTSATSTVDPNKNKKVYSSNPTYSRGNTVTDEDLEKLSEALYIKETNNANRYITLNVQKPTTSSSPIDQAPQPLLTVSPEALQIPTVQRVLSIFDNYQLDTHTNEYISPAQRQEESLLVDTFLSTNVMATAMRFLADKSFIRQDYYEYKDTLRRIWFNLFSRGQGKIGSTGFEHVFMAETRQTDSNTEVLGLHNWIYFNAEEMKRHVDYLGYINKVDLGNKGSIVKVHAKFNGHDKPVTALFVGTSPELEMALYTVCFYVRPDGKCPVSLGGTKFNIVTYRFRYRGKDLVGTAYPEI